MNRVPLNKYLINFISPNTKKFIFADYNNGLDSKSAKKIITKIISCIGVNKKKGSGVGIYLPRNLYYLVSIFSVLVSGNYFIPLNQSWPRKHLIKIINHSKPKFIISDKKLNLNKHVKILRFNEILKIKKKTDFKFFKFSENRLAYIVYTSGSSGEQKGVMISRKGFLSYLDWVKNYFKKKMHISKLIITGEMTFDIAMADIANALAFKSTIYLTPQTNNLIKAVNMIYQNKIDTIYGVPTTLRNLFMFSKMRKNKELKSIKNIFCGGDIFDLKLLKLIRSENKKINVFNMYGPTEVSMNCLCQNLTNFKLNNKTKVIPNGKGFAHLDYKLLNLQKNKIDKNFGELIVSGDQCMNGYLKDNIKTKLSFTKYKGKNYYKTGDLFKKKNNIFFYEGRKDKQIKIKGYRVSLNSIDLFLQKLLVVKESKTILLTQEKIITFCVLNNMIKNKVKKDKFLILLKKNLPNYMIPNEIIFLNKIPYNESGKFDETYLKKNYLFLKKKIK